MGEWVIYGTIMVDYNKIFYQTHINKQLKNELADNSHNAEDLKIKLLPFSGRAEADNNGLILEDWQKKRNKKKKKDLGEIDK